MLGRKVTFFGTSKGLFRGTTASGSYTSWAEAGAAAVVIASDVLAALRTCVVNSP